MSSQHLAHTCSAADLLLESVKCVVVLGIMIQAAAHGDYRVARKVHEWLKRLLIT